MPTSLPLSENDKHLLKQIGKSETGYTTGLIFIGCCLLVLGPVIFAIRNNDIQLGKTEYIYVSAGISIIGIFLIPLGIIRRFSGKRDYITAISRNQKYLCEGILDRVELMQKSCLRYYISGTPIEVYVPLYNSYNHVILHVETLTNVPVTLHLTTCSPGETVLLDAIYADAVLDKQNMPENQNSTDLEVITTKIAEHIITEIQLHRSTATRTFYRTGNGLTRHYPNDPFKLGETVILKSGQDK